MTLAAVPINFLIGFLSFVFCLCSLQANEKTSLEPIFTPPKGWYKNPSDLPSSRVKISFFTKAKKEFCPSINLTEEKVSLSTDQYIKAIQKLYETDIDNRFRRLGTLKTKAGTAHLTSLDTETALGKVRVLQSILLHENTAYILTGAVLQEDFGLYQKELIDSFRSFSLVSSLEGYLENDLQKKTLIDHLHKLLSSPKEETSSLEPFKRFIANEFKEQGLYFQLLLLEETQKKLSKSQN